MTDKLVTGSHARPAIHAEGLPRVHAQGVEETGRDGRPPAPTPKRIVAWRRCNVCRERKTCAIDVFGNWNCAECEECFE